MDFPIFLAHGTLGNWDELIFLGVVTVFMLLMGVSWVRSRANAESEDAEMAALADKPAGPETASDETDSSGHFKLQ